jgi:hypothetical protein
MLLRGGALRIAEKLLESTDDATNLELADRIEVAPKKRDVGAHVGVQVIVANGQAIGEAPKFPTTLSPVTFALDAPSQGAASD